MLIKQQKKGFTVGRRVLSRTDSRGRDEKGRGRVEDEDDIKGRWQRAAFSKWQRPTIDFPLVPSLWINYHVKTEEEQGVVWGE